MHHDHRASAALAALVGPRSSSRSPWCGARSPASALLGGQVFTRFKGGEPTLLRAAIWGVVCVVGLRILSDVLHILPLFGFLGGLVDFMRYVLWAILMTLGAGALVQGEYQRRTVQSWWQQSQFNRRRATAWTTTCLRRRAAPRLRRPVRCRRLRPRLRLWLRRRRSRAAGLRPAPPGSVAADAAASACALPLPPAPPSDPIA